MTRLAVALVLGVAGGISWERNRPCGTRWANRELVKVTIALGRQS